MRCVIEKKMKLKVIYKKKSKDFRISSILEIESKVIDCAEEWGLSKGSGLRFELEGEAIIHTEASLGALFG